MSKNDDLKRNGSGYVDPTAYTAITNIEVEEKNLHMLLKHIKYICNLAGFEVVGRITLKNYKSGRVWK